MCVYFIYDPSDSTAKIGYTGSIGRRYSELKSDWGKQLILLGYLAKAPQKVETFLHRSLPQDERIQNDGLTDWFMATDSYLTLYHNVSFHSAFWFNVSPVKLYKLFKATSEYCSHLSRGHFYINSRLTFLGGMPSRKIPSYFSRRKFAESTPKFPYTKALKIPDGYFTDK